MNTIAGIFFDDFVVPDGGGGQPPSSENNSELTDREQEVLAYLAEGANNEEIATSLVISPKIVARHRENIMRSARELLKRN